MPSTRGVTWRCSGRCSQRNHKRFDPTRGPERRDRTESRHRRRRHRRRLTGRRADLARLDGRDRSGRRSVAGCRRLQFTRPGQRLPDKPGQGDDRLRPLHRGQAVRTAVAGRSVLPTGRRTGTCHHPRAAGRTPTPTWVRHLVVAAGRAADGRRGDGEDLGSARPGARPRLALRAGRRRGQAGPSHRGPARPGHRTRRHRPRRLRGRRHQHRERPRHRSDHRRWFGRRRSGGLLRRHLGARRSPRWSVWPCH